MLFQLCLGSHCHGVPFGQRLEARRDQSSMQTVSDHVDWSRYTLPAPAHSGKKGVLTCLVVLTLLAAFPELDRVPAQNKAGKAVAAQWRRSQVSALRTHNMTQRHTCGG